MTSPRTLTVAELMERLREMPPELPVLVEGYETGLDAIHSLSETAVIHNTDCEDWDGEFEEPENLPSDPQGGAPFRALLILGRRGSRR